MYLTGVRSMTAASESTIAGPTRPWFGLPFLEEFREDPLGVIASLRRDYGRVVRMRILNETIYFVFAPELVRQLIVDHSGDLISQEHQRTVFRRSHGESVLTTEGDAWKRQRRVLTPAFFSPVGRPHRRFDEFCGFRCLDISSPGVRDRGHADRRRGAQHSHHDGCHLAGSVLGAFASDRVHGAFRCGPYRLSADDARNVLATFCRELVALPR